VNQHPEIRSHCLHLGSVHGARRYLINSPVAGEGRPLRPRARAWPAIRTKMTSPQQQPQSLFKNTTQCYRPKRDHDQCVQVIVGSSG